MKRYCLRTIVSTGAGGIRSNESEGGRASMRRVRRSTVASAAGEATEGAEDSGAQCTEKEVEVEWDEGCGVRHGVRPRTASLE